MRRSSRRFQRRSAPGSATVAETGSVSRLSRTVTSVGSPTSAVDSERDAHAIAMSASRTVGRSTRSAATAGSASTSRWSTVRAIAASAARSIAASTSG